MKLSTSIFYLILLLSCSAFCTPLYSLDEYRKISVNGKIGLENITKNQVVISPLYDDIGWSDQSLLVIDGVIGFMLNDTWGLINLKEKRIAESQYTVLYPFTNKQLIASKKSKTSLLEQYGIINTAGKIITPLEYQELLLAYNNLIATKNVNGRPKVGILNASLKTLIPVIFQSIIAVGKTSFSVKNDYGLMALYDSNGVPKSEFHFETIEPLDGDNLIVSLYDRKGIIDVDGNIIINPIYKDIRIENKRYVATFLNKWTLLDANNKKLNSYFFDQMFPLSNSSLAVQINDNTGIINQKEDYLNHLEGTSIIDSKFGLLTVRKGQYKGVVGHNGKLILPIIQDSVRIEEHVIFGKINKSNCQVWTPYDRSGKRIGYFNYEQFERAGDSLIWVKRNGKWGLLSNFGEEISSFSFDSVGSFKNGMTIVKYLNKYGVIDENGFWIVIPQMEALKLFGNRVLFEQKSEYGIIDETGKVLYRSQNKIQRLGEHFIEEDRNNKYLLLDKDGNRALLEPVDTVYYAHPSLYIFYKNKQWQMLNTESAKVIKLKKNIEKIVGMKENLIMAKIDNHWGFIRKDGRLGIANRYDSLQFYSEGLAAINLIEKWGFIDGNENIIIQPIYEFVSPFTQQLSVVKNNGLYGIINSSGSIVLDIKYDNIELKSNHIIFYKGDRIGLANRKGEVLRNAQYTSIEEISEGQFLVFKNGNFGVISIEGLDIIPVSYDKIIPYEGKFLVMEKASQSKIILN